MNRLTLPLALVLTVQIFAAQSGLQPPAEYRKQRELLKRLQDSVLVEQHRSMHPTGGKTVQSSTDSRGEVDITYSAEALWANAIDIAINGNYAYCIFPNELLVIDISNVNEPTFLARLHLSRTSTSRIVTSESCAFITGPGLTVVNIESPASPVVVANPIIGQFAMDIAVVDSIAYLLDFNSLKVLDITNPQNPTLLGSCAVEDFSNVVRVANGFAYVSFRPFFNPTSGLQVVDVSNPEEPIVRGSCTIAPYIEQLAVVDSFAYAVSKDSGLQIVDVADPDVPYLVGSYLSDSLDGVIDMEVDDGFVYVTNWSELMVIDISDVNAPQVTSSFSEFPWLWDLHRLTRIGNHLVVINLGSISMVDISDPSNPFIDGQYPTGLVNNVCLQGSYVYVADDYRGLRIIDVSNPEDPIELGGYVTGDPIEAVAVQNNIAYIVGFDFRTVDVSNPESPVLLGTYENLLFATNISVADTLAYVLNLQGLTIINVAEPSLPLLIGSYPFNNYSTFTNQGVEIADTLVYLPLGDAGVQILNVSDPTSPVLVGSYPTAAAKATDVVDTLMYVADEDSGLVIVNVADPQSPKLVGSYSSYLCRSVRVYGDYAYLGSGVFEAVNISNPKAPHQAGIYYGSGLVQGFSISDQYVYVANWTSFLVLQIAINGYVCGDADADGVVTISDVVFLVNYIFGSGPTPDPMNSGDTDCDGIVTVADVVLMVNYIFADGAPPCAACP